MSQVIIWFLFPIGLYFYFFKERPSRPNYNKIFTDYEIKVQNDSSLSDTDKMQRYKEMLLKNEYKITQTTPECITGEKKIFSMSLFTMSAGLYLVGVIFYLLYWYYVQTPHKVIFRLHKDASC